MSRVSHLSPGAICALICLDPSDFIGNLGCESCKSDEIRRGGELAMLGITPTRSATILASTLCIMWEVLQANPKRNVERGCY